MATSGFSVIKLSEYQAGFEERIHETSIRRAEIYTAMLRLASSSAEAATTPMAVRHAALTNGSAVVRLAFLDPSDLKSCNPPFERMGSMEGGLWRPHGALSLAQPIQAQVSEIYLHAYDDGISPDWLIEASRPRDLVGSSH